MAIRERHSSLLLGTSIAANAVLMLLWFVVLHLVMYQDTDNAVLLIPYYLFGIIFCVPISAINEFFVVRRVVRSTRAMPRVQRIALVLLAGAVGACVLFGVTFAVVEISGQLTSGPSILSTLSAWLAFAAIVLFPLMLAIVPPCYAVLLVRLACASRAAPVLVERSLEGQPEYLSEVSQGSGL